MDNTHAKYQNLLRKIYHATTLIVEDRMQQVVYSPHILRDPICQC